MIKFFRKTRQKLLSEGKTGNYFKYAIGEIILVVIGILIALQINNWNNDAIAKKQETALVKRLTADLNNNLEEIEDISARLNINQQGVDSLVSKLRRKAYHRQIPIYVSFAQRKTFFTNSSSAYQMIRNGMATYFTNDTVLEQVLNLYEIDFKEIDERQILLHEEIDYLKRAFIFEYFEPAPLQLKVQMDDYDKVFNTLFVPLDFDKLANNKVFLNHLLQLRQSVENRLATLQVTRTKIQTTLETIKYEFSE